ncbi:MAG: class I SAM-dependent methyltransferase [Actinomycetota bacterium]|nr:class I SAM-dependent methyltransferase [Actinomycetota bacterium]
MQDQLAESRGDPSPLEFAVLQTRRDIDVAARELGERNLLPKRPRAVARMFARVGKVLGHPNPAVDLFPDPLKSWDVLRTIEAVSSSVEREESVLDVGSVASAVLPCLHALGYRSLVGIDLDERVRSMFHSDEIEYAVEDLTHTTRLEGSLAAITAVSVIEHGVDEEALLAEISRLLRPGGIFVFSTDYWPEKVDTENVRLFGLPWRVFSAEEVERLLARAARHGLLPSSDPRPHIREVGPPVVHFGGRSYTFLYGVLVRT